MEEMIGVIGVIFTVWVIMFFVFRWIILWYFRINEAVKNQETQIMLLSQILQTISGDAVPQSNAAAQKGMLLVKHIESGQTKAMSEADYQKLLSKPGNEGKFILIN